MAASPPGHKGAHLVDGVLRAGVHCESLEAAAAQPLDYLFLAASIDAPPRDLSALDPRGCCGS
jgi:hypothetical protein